MKEIFVKTLMSEDTSCLPPEAPLQLVVRKMVDQHYSCIIIIQNERPIGIITERDLVKLLNQETQKIDLSLPVADFMTSPVVSLNESQTLFDAIVISRAESIRHLPVVSDNECLTGVVTQSDLTHAHFRVIEMQSEMLEDAVVEKTEKLQRLNGELLALSMEDHLMKIGNRRAMEVDLTHTHSASLRYGHLYSVLLIDIDFFKLYNDSYGHQAGDDALKAVADLLKANIRGSDRLYRYGGEELLLILPHTNLVEASCVAPKLVSSILNGSIPHEKSPFEFLTISCGGACALNNGQMLSNWEKLVEQVDHNLYQAKNNGRNCSIVAQG
jgi:diguanylate cyclase (GGDEF)-like protein